MKTPRFLLLMLVTVLALLTPHRAEARHETSFDFFYDSLSPYGEWVQVADYGYCWRPTDVDPEWAPYADGYWAFTDAGWTWVSYEDFGGIVYHYGRWVRVEDAGWCWVPEYEWGPAWVSWRHSDDYVGWAPLPPEARWHSTIGFGTWVDRDYDIGPSSYSFCRVRDFGAPVLRHVIVDRYENVTLIRRTVNITNITYNTRYGAGPIVYNGGPNFALINQRSARPIPALKLVQNMNIDLAGLRDGARGDHRHNFNGQAVGNQLIVTAPFVKPPVDPQFLQPKVSKTFAADKVTHGWNGVKDEGARQELKQEVQRQAKGLTRETAPARAVVANDLKVLPAKADPQAPSSVAGHERPDKDRKGRPNETAGQTSSDPNAGQQGTPKAGTTAVVPPGTEEKPFQGKGRGPMSKDGQKPVAGDSNLKPFNSGTETDQKPQKNKPPGTFVPPDNGNAERQAEAQRQRQEGQAAAKLQQAEIQRQRQEAQAAAKQQQQADALRQQQQAEAAATRQRTQGEQGRGFRPQGDGGAFTEQQQPPKKGGGGGGGQQNQAAMEQQRAQREAAEQARRNNNAQEGQGQGQGQRPKMEPQQRPQQTQQPRVNPPGAPTATPADGRKKKDKDNQ